MRTLQGVRDAALRNDALWEIARVRFDQGVFQAARGACMAFPMPRNNPSASFMRHVCMGRAYLVWNRVALAEREIAAARAINPNDGELQLVIADSRRLASDLPGAEAAYHAAATAMPGRDDALLGLGQLYEMFQQLDRAQDHYTQALAAQPDDPAARLAVGRFLLRRRERPADAIPHLRSAVQDRPGPRRSRSTASRCSRRAPTPRPSRRFKRPRSSRPRSPACSRRSAARSWPSVDFKRPRCPCDAPFSS